MSLSKDELITDLRQQVATLTRLLQTTLDRLPPEASPGALRQRRYKASLKASLDDALGVTQSVTETSPNDAAPPTTPRTPVRKALNEKEDATEGVQGEGVSPKRHQVTPRAALDEAQGLTDALQRGFSASEHAKHLAAFRDYGAQVGWRSKAGPWKDYNAAYRTWLSHEAPVAPTSKNGHKPEAEIRYGPRGEKYVDGVLVMSEVGQ